MTQTGLQEADRARRPLIEDSRAIIGGYQKGGLPYSDPWASTETGCHWFHVASRDS